MAVDLILANRAFVDHTRPPGSSDSHEDSGSGGLLAAVRPVIEPWHDGGGSVWVGAGRGAFDGAFVDAAGFETLETSRGPLRHRRVFVDDGDWAGHYTETANGFLWPLLHLIDARLLALTGYYPVPSPPSAEAWDAYSRTNARFAAAALEIPARSAWVHDYQLALVPLGLRSGGFAGRIGFFLHTPMPDINVASEVLTRPARERFAEVVEGIIGADLVGLQTAADVHRLKDAAQALCGAHPTPAGLRKGSREVTIGAYPVGIDIDEVLDAGRQHRLPEGARAMVAHDAPLVVGLERADFTKGIPERLDAIAAAYDAGRRFNYCGYASPTREGVSGYGHLHDVIEEKARAVAVRAKQAGCLFLQSTEGIPWPEVVGLLLAADVVFTSSLADGMNLVPLQAAVVQALRPGGQRATVICGRGAGAAEAYSQYQHDGLVIVDALDPHGMRDALIDAVDGKAPRVSDRLIAAIQGRDARHWGTQYLNDLLGDCR